MFWSRFHIDKLMKENETMMTLKWPQGWIINYGYSFYGPQGIFKEYSLGRRGQDNSNKTFSPHPTADTPNLQLFTEKLLMGTTSRLMEKNFYH